ncbi:hypothetical protein [Devosia sp. A369]
MYVAAEPYFGAELAELWVSQSRDAGMADVYVESTFLILAATLGRYPADIRTDYVQATSAPEIIGYE